MRVRRRVFSLIENASQKDAIRKCVLVAQETSQYHDRRNCVVHCPEERHARGCRNEPRSKVPPLDKLPTLCISRRSCSWARPCPRPRSRTGSLRPFRSLCVRRLGVSRSTRSWTPCDPTVAGTRCPCMSTCWSTTTSSRQSTSRWRFREWKNLNFLI